MADRLLRPLGIGEIFDTAFELYKDNFVLFVLIAAVSAVPLSVATGLVVLRYSQEFVHLSSLVSNGLPELGSLFSGLSALLQSLALFAPLSLIGHGLQITALAAAASSRYLGQRASLAGSYLPLFKHIVPFAATALLYGLAMGLGFACCYLGLILPATAYAFTAHAFVVEGEDIGFWRAMRRSAGLVSGFGGRVFGTLCILAFVYGLLFIGMTFPLKFALETLLQIVPGSGSWFGAARAVSEFSVRGQVLEQMCGGLAGMILAPFLVSVLTVLYFDLRVRKEAFDIALLARSLQAPASTVLDMAMLSGGKRA